MYTDDILTCMIDQWCKEASPTVCGKFLTIKEEFKYSGVMLDIKLMFKTEVEQGNNQGNSKTLTVKQTCGKKWRRKSKVMNFLYNK